AFGGKLYFRASNGLEDTEPWVSDGTTAGTQRLADLAPGALSSTPTGFASLPGVGMVFAANKAPGDLPVEADVELYLSDGTPGGTWLLADIEPGHITGSSGGGSLVATSGRELFFAAADPVVGDEPRYRDGSGVLTLLADLWPGPDSSSPDETTSVWVDGMLLTFFSAYEPGIGRELYVTDGTPAGTGLVADIRPGSASSLASHLHAGPGKLFLRAEDGLHGPELWVSDGTGAGTQLLDLAMGLAGSWPDHFVTLDDQVLFAATVGGDREVWISDGTSAGTLELADLNPTSDSGPSQLTRVDQEVAFFVRAVGFSSWQSLAATDGTAAGTRVVFDPGMNLFIKDAGIAVLDGIAYFLASTPMGIELWRSDLTTAGTFAVALVPSSPYGTNDFQLTAADGRIFFRASAQDAVGTELGVELFTSDGTAAGTGLVLDLAPGADGSYPFELTPAGGGVYFVPQDDEVTPQVEPARELFFSDGTAAGTYQVGTRPPGELPWAPTELLSSKPTGLTLVDGDLYFVAEDPHAVGRELFRLVDPVAYVQVLEPSGSGQRLEAGAAELGGTVTIRATGAPAGALSLLAMGGTLALPSTTLVLPGSAAWIDPLTGSILSATVTESWSVSLPVPATPGLAGLAMTLQSWTLVGPGLLPAETSNGLAFVLGL
ncbi:MAG: hypothetical protein P1V81_14710, partial [Planctomycetota bacterium]|nr:hypothetical protein [Planctomycetota bacterium]